LIWAEFVITRGRMVKVCEKCGPITEKQAAEHGPSAAVTRKPHSSALLARLHADRVRTLAQPPL
jgi:hypothetical protein